MWLFLALLDSAEDSADSSSGVVQLSGISRGERRPPSRMAKVSVFGYIIMCWGDCAPRILTLSSSDSPVVVGFACVSILGRTPFSYRLGTAVVAMNSARPAREK